VWKFYFINFFKIGTMVSFWDNFQLHSVNFRPFVILENKATIGILPLSRLRLGGYINSHQRSVGGFYMGYNILNWEPFFS